MATQQRLSNRDIARAAALHVESIDDSLPALLGGHLVERLYGYLESSGSELVLVERVDGQIESVCVVSFEPESLQRRIARATFPELVWRAVGAVFANPLFRTMLWNTVRDAIAGAADPDKAPEITYVFTNTQFRGKHLGQRLIERVDTELRDRGFDCYFVKTLDDPSNRAIRFYDENGFERLGPRVEGGRTFVEFSKPLIATS
jgi:GNAT superfamily N-acetyltransferase